MSSQLHVKSADGTQEWRIEPKNGFNDFTCHQMHATQHSFPMTRSFMVAFVKRVHGNGGEVKEIFEGPRPH
jgi:hypothetical protein